MALDVLDSQKLVRPSFSLRWQLSGMMVRTMETVLAILVVQALNTVILVRSRHSMLLGNLALRQQLAVYQRKQPRPKPRSCPDGYLRMTVFKALME